MQFEKEKIAPLCLSTYGGIGIILLLMMHGIWYENAKKSGLNLPPASTLLFEPTILNCLLVSLPIAIMAFAAILLFVQKSTHDRQSDRLMALDFLPTMSFVVIVALGMAGNCLVPLATNWVQFIGAFVLGGIAGFSHTVIAESWRLKEITETAIKTLKSYPERTETTVKWLELEHTACLSQLQWLVWAAFIFTTGGFVVWLTQPNTGGGLDISVSNAYILFIWGVIGLYFGVVTPLGKRTYFLREQMRNIVCGTKRTTQ